LKQIGRGENLSCPLCEQCNEDDWHYLLDCNSRAVIQAAGPDEVISMREQIFNMAKEVIMHICRYESKDTAGKFEIMRRKRDNSYKPKRYVYGMNAKL
jgi:hypothetical protein